MHRIKLIDRVYGKCHEFLWHFVSTKESFVSPTVSVDIINASSTSWSVMATTLSFRLKPKIKIINNIREISIVGDSIQLSSEQ